MVGDRRMPATFEIIGELTEVEPIAAGPGVRVLPYLRKTYGFTKDVWTWPLAKIKSVLVRLPNGAVRRVELHWYEAHGIEKRDIKD